jgi:hypothetical protein
LYPLKTGRFGFDEGVGRLIGNNTFAPSQVFYILVRIPEFDAEHFGEEVPGFGTKLGHVHYVSKAEGKKAKSWSSRE